MTIKIDARQIRVRDALRKITGAADSEVDNVLRAVNSEVTPPLYLFANQPADLKFHVGDILVTNPETSSNKTIAPIANAIPIFVDSEVTADATGAGMLTPPAPGAAVAIGMSASQFRKFGISISSAGVLTLTGGTAAGTLAGAGTPAITTGLLPIGYVVLRTNGSNAVQVILDSDIYAYGPGANSGATVTGTANYVAVYDAVGTLTGIGAGAALTLGDISTTLAVPGKIRAGDGSAALPSYAFGTDTDTGIYKFGTNTIGFAADGIGQFLIGPSRDLDVVVAGTATFLASLGANTLTIAGATSTTTFAGHVTIGKDLIVDVSTLKVDSSLDRVGIRTAAPKTNLHVLTGTASGTAANANTQLLLENTTAATTHALEMLAASNGISLVLFSDTIASGQGQLKYDHSLEIMTFFTNGTAQFTMEGSRKFDVATAGATSLFGSLGLNTLSVGDSSSTSRFPGSIVTRDGPSGNRTIAVGDTLWHPFLTIAGTDTYTVNGQFVSAGIVTVNGTLVVNGTSITLD